MFFATAFGCLVLAVLGGQWLQPKEPHIANEQGFQEIPNTYRAGGSNCDPAKIRALSVRLRQKQTDACVEAEEQHREAANGIIEARRAADAADAQAISANQQARIATWGGIIGALTLIAAIAAALFAERAAFHSKSSHEAYRAREKATLVPIFSINGPMVNVDVENLGPTRAIIHLHNSTLLMEKPVGPIEFMFPGRGSINAIAVRGEGHHEFGKFAIPSGSPKAYFVGAIIYATVFGDAELLTCLVEIDLVAPKITPLYDGNWSKWEIELEKFRRRRSQ